MGQLAVVVAIQSLIIVGLGLARGASLPGGAAGVAVLIASAILLAWAIGGLSIAIALLARKEETLIGAVNFLVLPLTFLSTAFMPSSLAPGWVADVARYNPVNWAIEAGREALGDDPDWGASRHAGRGCSPRGALLRPAAARCRRTSGRSRPGRGRCGVDPAAVRSSRG